MAIDLTQIVLQYLPTDRKTNATGFYVCCPMCMSMGESRPDTKYRGGFTIAPDGGWLFHCYNCHHKNRWIYNGRVGKNLMYFLTSIGIPSKMIPVRLRLLRNDETLSVKIHIEEEEVPDIAINFDEVKLPSGCSSFDSWVEDDEPPSMFIDAFSYMASRGEAVFNGSTYYWTGDSNYAINQRVIIPFYHHGKVVGYTGRVFTGNKKLRKYYSEQQSDYMYNQDLLEGDAEIIFLVEGILDAISIGGIGVLGNHLTEKQVNLLKWSGKRIILIPDRNDAGGKLFDQVVSLGHEVALISTEWGTGIVDCAEATKRFGILYTLETIIKNATKNKMKLKLFRSGMFRLKSNG